MRQMWSTRTAPGHIRRWTSVSSYYDISFTLFLCFYAVGNSDQYDFASENFCRQC